LVKENICAGLSARGTSTHSLYSDVLPTTPPGQPQLFEVFTWYREPSQVFLFQTRRDGEAHNFVIHFSKITNGEQRVNGEQSLVQRIPNIVIFNDDPQSVNRYDRCFLLLFKLYRIELALQMC
jgi:hypothetical protein